MLRPVRFLLNLVIIAFVVSAGALATIDAPAFAQTEVDLEAAKSGIESRAAALARLTREIDAEGADLASLQQQARDIRRAADAESEPVRSALGTAREDLSRLGDAPVEGAPAEAPEIQTERQRLETKITALDGVIRQSALNIGEADRLIEEIARRRRDAFSRTLLASGPSPFEPREIGAAVSRTLGGVETLRSRIDDWRAARQADGALERAGLSFTVAALIALALFLPIRRRINDLIRTRIKDLEPTDSLKVIVATLRTLAAVAPGVLAGLIVFEAMRAHGAIAADNLRFAAAVWIAFIGALLVDGAATGVFSPKSPKWRVTPLETASAFSVRALLVSAAAMLGAELILREGARAFAPEADLAFMIKAASAIVLAAILFVLGGARLWRVPPDVEAPQGPMPDARPHGATPAHPVHPAAPPVRSFAGPPPEGSGQAAAGGGSWWPRIRFLARLIAIAAAAATSLGYVNLGHYLTSRTFLLAGLCAVIWSLRALLREAVRLADRRFSRAAPDDRLTLYWVGLLIDAASLLALTPPALLLIGVEWPDVRDGFVDALVGIQIGPVKISLSRIAAAAGVMLALLALTRVVQRTAESRIFPRSRINTGVQNSLKTLIGYVGLIIALAAGVSTLGLNLSNLAIIAGALSVGIGFGLQSIVNNFVSGLILLFERPIKVGDWIVTASGEGIVKRISVRSTEIETFDRSAVIIPNSELISSAVTNWTHRDKMGRVIVAVGVSYDADPDTVIRLLEEVARDHPAVLSYPAPFVYFVGFGDSSLNFDLRGFVRDVTNSLTVKTELRVAIFRKLKDAGISIPFPQRELRLHAGSPASAGLEVSPPQDVTPEARNRAGRSA